MITNDSAHIYPTFLNKHKKYSDTEVEYFKEALIFQNALLLIVLGSSVVEYKFTKPKHALINSLMGMITLLTEKYEFYILIHVWGNMERCLVLALNHLKNVGVLLRAGPFRPIIMR
jgi:hypothetical protein